MVLQRAHLVRWTLVLIAAAVWAFAFLSLVSFDATDWPSHAVYPWGPTHNLCGAAGALLAYYSFFALGSGAYAVLFFTAVFIGMKLGGQTLGDPWLRAVGLVLLAISLGAATHLISPAGTRGLPEGAGGLLGMATTGYLRSHFSGVGTGLILFVCLLMGLLLAADELVIRLPTYVGGAYRKVKAVTPNVSFSFPPAPRVNNGAKFVTKEALESASTAAIVKREKNRIAALLDQEEEAASMLPVKIERAAKRLKKLKNKTDEEADAIVDAADVVEVPEEPAAKAHAIDESDSVADAVVVDEASEAEIVDPEPVAEVPAPTPEAVKRDILVRLPSNVKPKRTAPPPPKELGEYSMPGWDCLEEAEHGYAEQQEKFVREKAAELERALHEFGVEAHVTEIDTGPVITMYELSLAPGIKVSTITALTNDIARALSAVSIRIIAPVPGKNTVGIEVPNNEKEKVRLKELMQTAPEATAKMDIPLYLGKDASGNPLIADLTKMPHCLIAGTTGSGKSVCINTIILSVMYTQRPDMVKLILVDPKVVEMAPFRDIPHLMCPVITESAKATSVLEWACTKMEERYALLAEAGVRNIGGYNKLTKEELIERFNPGTPEEEAKIPKKLPFIVIIIDELADLMMTSGKEVESHIVRIAQKARAVGIHLVLATQRPQATVVTGLIKANMPSKIAFRVGSRMDSRIVLDMNGAEVLLGQGDMLYMPNGASKPTRCQGTFIDDKEIRDSVKLLKSMAEQQFEHDLVQIKAANIGGPDDEEKDPLFDDAVRVVLETKRGSVSLLQRRLTIGYGRASRLIEQMAAAGLVGEYKGSQAREATITLEEWEAMKAAQQQDEETGMSV
ncbi:MAG: DNA translocase FtsK 4TM domain-containing protein [Tepidisphaeraceae bacterium]